MSKIIVEDGEGTTEYKSDTFVLASVERAPGSSECRMVAHLEIASRAMGIEMVARLRAARPSGR